MKRVIKILAVAGGATALGLLIASASLASTHGKKAHESATQHVTVVIKSDAEHGKKGPDGKWHDAFLPANLKVKAGDKVVVTVRNYDDGLHSFTSPTLHVNKIIKAAKDEKGGKVKPVTTKFTFVAPKKAGKYLWWCNQPCDPWAMAHTGYMRGYVKVHA
jgi:plastocyanin